MHGAEIQETRNQSVPSGCISRSNFPVARCLVPAKHFQFRVPSFLRASTGRILVSTQLCSSPSIRQVNLQCQKRNSSKNRPQLQRMMLITLNIVCMSWSKKLQCIRCESHWEHFIAELHACHFDLLFVGEMRRGDNDGTVITEKGQHIFLSGGAIHEGVGNCISANFASHIVHNFFTHIPKHLPFTFLHGVHGVHGVQAAAFTFQRLGMRMAQRNKCMM